MIADHFSVGSNDMKQLNFQTFIFFMIAIALFLVLVVAALVLFEADGPVVRGFGSMGMFWATGAAWWGYKLLLNKGRTDLLSKPE